MAGLFSISYMGCHPKPIDELHHFSRRFFNHQAVICYNQTTSADAVLRAWIHCHKAAAFPVVLSLMAGMES